MAGETDSEAGQQTSETEGAVDMVPKTELTKVIDGRDAAKVRARAAEAELVTANQSIADLTAGQISPERIELLTQIEAERAEAERTTAMEAGDAEALAAQARAPVEQKNVQLTERLAQRDAQLSQLLQDGAVVAAATAAGAVNPSQVAMLLKGRISMTEDPAGKLVPAFTGPQGQAVHAIGGETVTMATFVASFLAEAGNENLVKSSVTPGSGATPAGGETTTNKTPKSFGEYMAIPEADRPAVWEKMSTEEREATYPTDGNKPKRGSLMRQ